jgi:asparagine synthetase B (glutamine-hydrolysing)
MLESLLRIRNFYWADAFFRPPLDADSDGDLAPALARLRGQFSLAFRGPEAKLILARDRLGSNKLFFTIHPTGTVAAANYLIDLVSRDVPFEAVHSVPAGHFLEIDLHRGALSLRRYFHLEAATRREEIPLSLAARNIRQQLEVWFARLAEQFRHRKICVCLSGGLDSSMIAALATKHFPDVTAYTYGFVESGEPQSADVFYASQVADFLGLPLRLVRATSHDVLDVLDDALCYGQDWREFNVHCAIVNEILARSIERDAQESGRPERPLVLTGDLMNELLADYVPLSYAGREIYKLPRVGPQHLRAALLRGLDAGDREVGIFNHHGLDVVQPYGLVTDQLLPLPGSFIGGENSKQLLAREIAGDLLPSFLFARAKARAQIGDPLGPGGILATLQRAGCDSRWLRQAFSRRFMVKEERSLDGFIRLGRYRFLSEFPHGR